MYVLEVHHYKVLTLLCEALDRAAAARAVIDRDGATYTDRWGQPKMRPETLIERDSRDSAARLLKLLDLDRVEPGPIGRPPSRY